MRINQKLTLIDETELANLMEALVQAYNSDRHAYLTPAEVMKEVFSIYSELNISQLFDKTDPATMVDVINYWASC